MNERIKEIREYFNLTQDEFGKRIGSARNTIANYENGNRNPSNAVVTSICREFSINEEWLRAGQGEMFIKIPEEDLFSRAAASCVKDDDAVAMEGLILWRSLPPEARKNVEEYILRLADLIREHKKE